jgi:hypothetical protein
VTALWQPYWKAATAYSVTAVVIPTVFAGYTWRCTTAGTSGNVEPVWPDPLASPTIADGTVTWSVGTGVRQAFQAGLKSIVSTFAQANPTIIRSVRTVRPLSLANVELPCFYIGDMSETLNPSQGVWSRTFSGFSAFLADAIGSIDESNDRMNFAADALADLFVLNPHAGSGRSIFQHVATNDFEIDEKGAKYPALEFQFAPTEALEGRS